MNTNLFIMALSLSSSLYMNTVSAQAQYNTADYQNLQEDQQYAEDLLLKLIQIEMTYHSYLQAQETGESIREFTDSFDSHFKVLSRQIEAMNAETKNEKALETLDMFFKKFDSLYSSIGRVQAFSEYFRAPFEAVRILKSKINNQILQNNFKQCYTKSEIPNASENGSVMIEILNALSEYKCYLNTYRTADISIQNHYKDKINEYFGVIKQTESKISTHYSPRKNRGISLFKKRGMIAHTKTHKFISQNYIAEKDIFSQYILGNPEELQHLNTPNGNGQNAIELAISLNLDNIAQILTEALSDFAQTLENRKIEPLLSEQVIEQKIQNLPSSYKTALTRDEMISIIQENPNANDRELYSMMYAKIQENTKENMKSNAFSENRQEQKLSSYAENQKIIPSNPLQNAGATKTKNSILSRFTMSARH
ncbi:MAG: hypothetical protein C0432_04485 [Candidatus Puniceispirillum sp.]|nr:hypothetical protein [Candidatus Puniceispirillum sp.]